MKLKNILLGAICFAVLASCDEQLNYKEYSIYDTAYMQKKFERAGGFLSTIYADLESDFGNYDGATLASATDEAVYSHDGASIESFYNGAWSPTNANNSIWTTCYHGIAYCNLFLDEFTGLKFEDYILDKNYEAEMYQYNNYQWEARWARAYFYFLLVRQYGGVPLITSNMSAEEASVQPRATADEVFAFIDSECDAIKDSITKDYGDLGNLAMSPANNGRANNLAVLALKARAALYHASPLFNPNNDQTLWQKAARANQDVVQACTNRSMKLSSDYKGLFIGNTSWSDAGATGEIIFGRRMPTENRTFETNNFPVGITGAGAGGGGGNCPTYNLVSAYEEGDTRFAQTVACNGDSWPNANTVPLETYYGGVNGLPTAYATPTGYYLKKYVTESVQIAGNGANTCKHVWVTFRLAEFYLNLAEAYLNLTDKGSFAANTASKAINTVRKRAGLADLTDDEATLEACKKERFVELAFEGHRFFDVRRWKEADKYFTNIQGVDIKKNADGTFTETPKTVQNRQWSEKMYLFPIPQSEILKSGGVLTQNPGW